MDDQHTRNAAKRLAALIVSSDDHWSRSAQTLLAGLLSYWLHVALQEQLNTAARFADPDLPVEQLWKQMRARCPAVAEAVDYLRNASASERASVELVAYRATVVALERFLSDGVAPASAQPRRERKHARVWWLGRADSL